MLLVGLVLLLVAADSTSSRNVSSSSAAMVRALGLAVSGSGGRRMCACRSMHISLQLLVACTQLLSSGASGFKSLGIVAALLFGVEWWSVLLTSLR
jgi:hypothetical protein